MPFKNNKKLGLSEEVINKLELKKEKRRKYNKKYKLNNWAKVNISRTKTRCKYKDKYNAQATEHRFNVYFGGNRQTVLERDNFECQHCGLSIEQHLLFFGQVISLHHIDFDNTNNDLSNLITLCCRCHRKEHWKEKRRSM
jgi:5-methylcytosine-specific restriction endonuclease McrA